MQSGEDKSVWRKEVKTKSPGKWEYQVIYRVRRDAVKGKQLKFLPQWAAEKKWKDSKLTQMLSTVKQTAINKHKYYAKKGVACVHPVLAFCPLTSSLQIREVRSPLVADRRVGNRMGSQRR